MPHFFIKSENVSNNIVQISDTENYKHIAKALRAKVGEKLLLIDENQIQYETVIKDITSKEIIAEIKDKYKSKRFLDFELYLAQSPLRSEAQSVIIEKATELGVTGVYPIATITAVSAFNIKSPSVNIGILLSLKNLNSLSEKPPSGPIITKTFLLLNNSRLDFK